MKQFITTITAPCGVFEETPKAITLDNNIKISFKLLAKNSIELTISFEETAYTKEQAEKLSVDITKDIALRGSFKDKLNFEWSGIVSSNWQIAENKHSVQKSLSVRYCVVRGAKLVTDLNEVTITDTTQSKTDYIGTLELYNKALAYLEKSGTDNEVAFWLLMTYESLQVALEIDEHNLKKLLVDKSILSKKELSTYKFSIGSYYRHKKEVNSNKNPYPIRQCVEITHKLIEETLLGHNVQR